MKIVRIIARLNVGGPARHVVWLNEALRDDEFDSILLAGSIPLGEEDMSYFAEEHNVKPIFIEEMSRELSLKDIVSLWKVYRYIRQFKPQIIHTHTAKAGTIGRAAGFLYRWLTPKTLIGKPNAVKIIHTFHGHVFHSYYGGLKTSIFLFIERMLARITTHRIVVISELQKKEINERFGVGKKEQFEVIPLGLDLEPFSNSSEREQALRNELGVDDSVVLIGLVGRLTEVKNHKMFLETVAALKGAVDETKFAKLKFVLVGDGHLRTQLERIAEELEIVDSLEFLGNRTDPEVFYPGLDIVALTSLNEGTPLSLIEAMACEKPVISTKVGGVSDLLGRSKEQREGFWVNDRGISVESCDVNGFQKGLLYLIENDEVREAMAKRGISFVTEKYSKRRLVDDIKNLYRRISPS